MSEYIVRTKAISKFYKNKSVLDHIDMNIKKGDIYGFIGRNGAGKTTMIRVLMGMVTPTSGEIELFGKQGERSLIEARKRMGAIVNAPVLHTNMSAKENLEICRLQRGIPGKQCIDKIMETMGLIELDKKRVRHFSLGMKQRLGIAMALLADPEFLVLDEPTNGLDPMGIIDLRKLILKLNKERETTILISSHHLREVHEVASHYGIIEEGILIEEISAKALGEKCKNYVHIKVDDINRATTILDKVFGAYDFEVFPEGIIKLYHFKEDSTQIAQALIEAHIGLKEIMPIGEDLEHYFTRRIGGMHS